MMLRPHHHHPQRPESDGLRYCDTCGSCVSARAASGGDGPARFFEGDLPDGSSLILQAVESDHHVTWMNRWERWPAGLRAGFLDYAVLPQWGGYVVYVTPDAWPASR